MKKTLLLLDDDINLLLYHKILFEEYAGFNCIISQDACEAIEKLNLNLDTISGLVLDAFIPSTTCNISTSIDFCKEIQYKGIFIPTLFLTSLSSSLDIVKLQKYGRVITKPLEQHFINNSKILANFISNVSSYNK
jgi:response regulator of citrate/malate metabolism